MPPVSIVIERLGGSSRDHRAGAKSWDDLKKHGVAGLIVYADPMDDAARATDVKAAMDRLEASVRKATAAIAS